MPRIIAVLAAAILVALPIPAWAQSQSAGAQCLDSIPASAMRPEMVYLSNDWTSAAGQDSTLRMSVDLLTESVARRIRRVLSGAADRVASGPAVPGWREIGGDVDVIWRRDGTITAHPVPSVVPEIWSGHVGTSLVLSALDSVQAEGDVPPPVGMTADSAFFKLRYEITEHDSAGNVVPDDMRVGFPVFGTIAPWSAAVRTTRGFGPSYPAEWRMRGASAVVIAQFVVDVDGRAVDGSFRDVIPPGARPWIREERRAYADFVQAVREWVPKARFIPARIGGCVVRQLVQQPFTFKFAR